MPVKEEQSSHITDNIDCSNSSSLKSRLETTTPYLEQTRGPTGPQGGYSTGVTQEASGPKGEVCLGGLLVGLLADSALGTLSEACGGCPCVSEDLFVLLHKHAYYTLHDSLMSSIKETPRPHELHNETNELPLGGTPTHIYTCLQ